MKPSNICRLDFWAVYDVRSPGNLFVIPVNGSVNRLGHAVMGRGLAKDAAIRYPLLPKEFGDKLKDHANIVRIMDQQLALFPVKYKWYETANVELIASSCRQLSVLVKFWKYKMVYLPHVGCGNGGLQWETQVRPVVETNMSVPYVIVQPKS